MSTAEGVGLTLAGLYVCVYVALCLSFWLDGRRQSRYRRKLSYGWTCSGTAHHFHKWYWAAWACGKWQQFKNRKGVK